MWTPYFTMSWFCLRWAEEGFKTMVYTYIGKQLKNVKLTVPLNLQLNPEAKEDRQQLTNFIGGDIHV